MTARRQAAAALLVVPAGVDGVPRAIRLGPCMEVWALEGHVFAQWSALRRYGIARDFWLAGQGLDPVSGPPSAIAEGCRIAPEGRPWSVEESFADDDLARVGCTRTDLPALRSEARQLLRAAARDEEAS